MRAPLNGGVVRLLLIAAVLATTGCESVFHWCMNGRYGAPYWDRLVYPSPNPNLANPIKPRDCASLCQDRAAERCEIAEGAGASYLICFEYRENGCPSGWSSRDLNAI